MNRQDASKLLRDKLNEHGLKDWSVRLNQNADSRFLGLCSYKDKCIILSAHHIDIHPDADIKNTILHEVAHALTPGCGHDDTWSAKAREIGCDNTLLCSNLSLNPDVIDAIRSGATVEVTFEEHVIRTPKFNITRLQDKCDVCGMVAKTVSEVMEYGDDDALFDVKVITLECEHVIRRNIPRGTPFHKFQMGGIAPHRNHECACGHKWSAEIQLSAITSNLSGESYWCPKCEKKPAFSSEVIECAHEWDKNKCLKCGRFRPYEFQQDGMRFLEAALSVNRGGACFDEMGIGKTIQAMGTVFFHPELCAPTLWIVKSGLRYQFQQAILMWCGDDSFPQIVNSSTDWLIPKFKHYIISYDMLVPKNRTLKSGKVVSSGFDIKQFDRVGIKCVVLDECQQIKNVDSSRTQMVRRVVKDRKVIALSGTPWKNRGSELFPVLNMMDPMKFYSAEAFKRQWVDTYWHGNQLKEGGIKRITQFKEYTKDLCIRRERTEVMSELPLINRTKLYVKMDAEHQTVYDEAVDEFVAWYETQVENLSGMAIIAAMQKMRHIVALAKIPATMEYIDEFVEDTDRKLVIFAHHKDVQSILFDELTAKYAKGDEAIPVYRLTSDMSGQDRHETALAFNASTRCIMVASTLAAGEGLNLQTCSDCVMHERQWNPANEEQAEGRFIRIGQTAEVVNATYAEMQGLTTIDPQLDAIVERKRIQFHNAHNKGEAVRWSDDSIIKELAESIVRAHKSKKAA